MKIKKQIRTSIKRCSKYCVTYPLKIIENSYYDEPPRCQACKRNPRLLDGFRIERQFQKEMNQDL